MQAKRTDQDCLMYDVARLRYQERKRKNQASDTSRSKRLSIKISNDPSFNLSGASISSKLLVSVNLPLLKVKKTFEVQGICCEPSLPTYSLNHLLRVRDNI
jgi:hypothetical protein